MKKLLTIICLVALSVTLFSQSDTSKYVVIADGWSPFQESKSTTLSKNDLNDIEFILKKCVDSHNTELKQKNGNIFDAINLDSYKRQYVGVINNKGEKEVWVNCFCRQGKIDWKKEIIMTADGGNCYFNLKINLTTGKYYNLQINSGE